MHRITKILYIWIEKRIKFQTNSVFILINYSVLWDDTLPGVLQTVNVIGIYFYCNFLFD